MVELRKRPAPATTAAPAPAAKRSASKPRTTTSKAKGIVQKAKAAVIGDAADTSEIKPTVPDSETVGATGEIPEAVGAGTMGAQTSADEVDEPIPAPASTSTAATAAAAKTPLGSSSIDQTLPPAALSTSILTVPPTTTTTLSTLLSNSTKGIIIFTYPKASTPGCTTQACLFRDNYDALRAQGYEVYGLSHDSEKANGTFKTKQNLQYTMLCDPEAKLTGVLGMKKPGNAKGVLRGVVVLDKLDGAAGGVVRVWFQGGPQKTLDSVHEFLG